MYFKIVRYIFCCISLIPLLSACFSDDDESSMITIDADAELLTFSLSHDSIPELASVKFSIDQIKGLIFNLDSMAYGTEIVDPVAFSYTSVMSYVSILNLTNNDSIWLSAGDSLDVSIPNLLKVFAPDGVTTKHYTLTLNIHQVDPDSMQYKSVAQSLPFLNAEVTNAFAFNDSYYLFVNDNSVVSLYQSDDAISWQASTLGANFPANAIISDIQTSADQIFVRTENGQLFTSFDFTSWTEIETDYPILAILGYLKSGLNQSSGLSVIFETPESAIFAFLPDGATWQQGGEVTENFPVTDFSVVNTSAINKETITLVGGKSASGDVQNRVWSTQDGLYWAGFESVLSFPKLEGANAFLYNDEIYLLNGKLENGSYNKKVYSSIDKGLTWSEKADKAQFPEAYIARKNASLLVDKNGMSFYVIGGQNTNSLTDIWQGYVNEQFFAN